MEHVHISNSMNIADTTIIENKKYIALTFDDGPNTTTTLNVINILKKYNVVATFFVIGNSITEDTTYVIKEAKRIGCEIGNHSNTHKNLCELTEEEIIKEIEETNRKIYEAIGEYPRFFRPPYLAMNEMVYNLMHLPVVGGIGAKDWDDSTTVEEIVTTLSNEIRDGHIVLLHDFDGNEKTVEAIDIMIPKLIEDGYEFLTLEDMFKKHMITHSKYEHKIYSNLVDISN